ARRDVSVPLWNVQPRQDILGAHGPRGGVGSLFALELDRIVIYSYIDNNFLEMNFRRTLANLLTRAGRPRFFDLAMMSEIIHRVRPSSLLLNQAWSTRQFLQRERDL